MLESKHLKGRDYYLRPVEAGDREVMRALFASDPENWRMQTSSALGEDFEAYWAAMLDTPARIAFAIIDARTETVIGSSSFFQIDGRHRTVEIGYTFFHPSARGTHANPESKWLMLSEAFSAGALRVQFSVAEANKRSQAAVLKLGAVREGLLRNHRITWTGEQRNTVLFSITDAEWPRVRERLEHRLGMPAATGA